MLLWSTILQSYASIVKQDNNKKQTKKPIYDWKKKQGHQVCFIKEQWDEVSSRNNNILLNNKNKNLHYNSIKN